MKKKFFKITFSFLFLPFFIISCASKPEAPVEDETQISAPVENDYESLNNLETEADTEAESDTENSETENEASDAAETESLEAEKEADTEEEDSSENELSDTLESESDSNDLPKESPDFENFEEPEVITLEYEEEEEPGDEAESEEEIKSEEIDLDYVDTVNDDEEIQIDSDEDEIEFISAEEETDEANESTEETIKAENEANQLSEEQEALEEENTEEEIEISRKVTMKLQEYLDISYPGNGWIYMGLTDGSKDLSYFGRKLGTKDTKFTLQAKKAGVKVVHFYRVDPLTGEYLDDYIEITIENEKGSNKTHIQTPEYQPPLPKKAKALVPARDTKDSSDFDTESDNNSIKTEETIKDASVMSGTNTKDDEEKYEDKTEASTSSSYSNIEKEHSENTEKTEEKNKIDTKSLLKEAQVLYNNEDYSSADKKIKTFLDYAVSDRDAGLFLQGQILEAKSDIQDIKAALEAYKTLTKNYPASPYWEEANKKIIYLNRFYLEIR